MKKKIDLKKIAIEWDVKNETLSTLTKKVMWANGDVSKFAAQRNLRRLKKYRKECNAWARKNLKWKSFAPTVTPAFLFDTVKFVLRAQK